MSIKLEGASIEGVGIGIFGMIKSVASGQETKSEILGHQQLGSRYISKEIAKKDSLIESPLQKIKALALEPALTASS